MLIGLTGPNAAGKGEVAALLAARGLPVYSLSDVVRERARELGLGVDRETLIRLGRELRESGGPGVLAERILARLEPRAVVDSIRSPFEVQVLRQRPDFRLLGVDAPVEIRWQRALLRGREGDRPDLDTFIAREELENRDSPTSQQLRKTFLLADRVVLNGGSLETLAHEVMRVLAEWDGLD